ncbi:MAG: pepsin/retropepsin-like aspartic protease family protein [Hyphococcus sp.]
MTPAPAARARFGFRYDYGQRLIVNCHVQGAGPHDFILDTAATRSVIFENLARQIEVEPSNKAPALVFGLSGIKEADTFNVGEVSAGGISIAGDGIPILPDWPNAQRTPQGVLGLDFFVDTLLVVSQDRSVVELYESDIDLTYMRDSSWVSAPLERSNLRRAERPLLIVTVRFPRYGAMPLIVDTGSTLNVCNFPAAEMLRVLPLRARRKPESDFSDIHGGKVETYELAVRTYEIGNADLSGLSLVVTDAPFFQQIGFETAPIGVLGLDFWKRRNFALNLATNQLAFETV